MARRRPGHPPTHARPFIAWLERHDCRGLRVPSSHGGTPVLALDDHRRLAALRALLHHDATIDPRSRLAGCLVALYAQPAARIVRLTGADLELTGAGAQIRLGQGHGRAARAAVRCR